MIYPAYIHLGDEKTAHGVTLPDFLGCFSSADEYDDIPSQVQDAVELYFEGEDLEVPRPSDIVALSKDGEYEGGVWMLIDIDISKLDNKPVRLNISLPNRHSTRMDDYAKDHKLTRSALIVAATDAYMNKNP